MSRALLLFLTGCVELLDEHASPIGAIARECIVPSLDGAVLDAPVSLEYPDHSLWIWPEVRVGDATVANAAAIVTSVDEACDGVALLRDASGAPRTLLARTPVEAAPRSDGRRWQLVPTGGVVADGTGYLYYEHALQGPGFFDSEPAGTGLCVLRAGARACERVAIAGATVLWPPQTLALDRGGLVIDDGGAPRAVIAGCRGVAEFTHPCTVSGVPVADLRDPGAYRAHSVFRGWVESASQASVLADVAGQLTLSAYGDGYLATSLGIFDNRVEVRRSRVAVADYDHATPALDVVPSSTLFVRGGREHAALRPEPRSIAVSYFTDGAAAPGLHLVAFRFHGDFR